MRALGIIKSHNNSKMLIVTSNLNKSSTNWINYLSQRSPWRNKEGGVSSSVGHFRNVDICHD